MRKNGRLINSSSTTDKEEHQVSRESYSMMSGVSILFVKQKTGLLIADL